MPEPEPVMQSFNGERSGLPRPASARSRSCWNRIAAAFLAGQFTTGCEPVLNFYGSYFPAWAVSLVIGIVLASLLRWLFAVTRLEPHLGPLLLVYPALGLLLTCLSWLLLFGP